MLCFNTAKIKIVCRIRCFSNAVLSIAECSVLATVFQQHSVLTSRNYFLITMFQQHTKKLVLINTKPTVTKTSSSHREIFTRDYAEEHLPLDRGITRGTLQCHKPIFHYLRKLQFQHCCALPKKKTLYFLHCCVCVL